MIAVSILFFLLSGIDQSPDLSKAHVNFEISHLGVMSVEGTFSEISGELKEQKGIWMAEGNILVRSVDTGNTSRDGTILSAPYLNVDEYPIIPFKVKMSLDSDIVSIQVEGQIRGLPFDFQSQLSQENNELISLPIVLNRETIGLDFGMMDSLIGNELTLIIHTGLRREAFD